MDKIVLEIHQPRKTAMMSFSLCPNDEFRGEIKECVWLWRCSFFPFSLGAESVLAMSGEN